MQQNNKRLWIIAAVVVVVFLLVGLLFLRSTDQKTDYVFIEGLESCSKGIRNDARDDLSKSMYGFVKAANDYNKITSAKTYNAKIRDKSCVTQKDETIRTASGKKQGVVSTKAIVDIPEAKQSWRVFYEWTPDKGIIESVINGASVECLAKNELVYGEFKCDNILSLQNYGTDKYDPILPYMPYDGESFKLSFNPDTKKISAQIVVRPKNINNMQLIENDKGAVLFWLKHRNLDPNNYTIEYTVKAQE